jgi:REP element-mobilizing transposase RayT
MNQFRKQSHTTWFCESHIVWRPKYRCRLLAGKAKEEVELRMRERTRQTNCEVVEEKVPVR